MSYRLPESDAISKENWRRKIEAGKRIRNPYNYAYLGFIIWIFLAWYGCITEELSLLAVLCFSAFSLIVVIILIAVIFSSVQFAPGYLEIQDWRGKLTRIEYDNIIAVNVRFNSFAQKVRLLRVWRIKHPRRKQRGIKYCYILT